jgi:predicted RNA-binding Zn-ribbon protein involved in translation (DUF1610 family)
MGPQKFNQRQAAPDVNSVKNIWSEDKSKKVWAFFCPNCRSERRLPFNPNPGRARHFIQVGLTTAVFTLLAWKWFGIRGVVSFLPFWAAFEIYFRTRVRAALSCPHCGFDPYLYLVDVKRARDEIEKHWRAKFAEKNIPFPEPEQRASFRRKETNPDLTENSTGS